jgi:hypoxanthine phosphoribosyltransferase
MSDVKKVYLSWTDVDNLISCELVPRLQSNDYDIVIAITRGGIVPGGMIAEQLGVQQILVASVDFYEDAEHNLDWPVFMQFPSDSLLRRQQVLIVDDVWYRGKEIVSVTERVEQAGGRPTSVVLHYKPKFSRVKDKAPDFYAAETEDWIIYPWEVDRSFLQL